jgi:hopanoid biosynthesis associated RND transporter like protein HpnN
MSDQSPTRPALVRRFLLALVGTVCEHPRLVLAISLILCLASGLASFFCLKYHTSRNDLISARKDYQQRWQKYLAEFGDDDDIVFVVEGADREGMKCALDAVAAELLRQPELFDRVFWKVDLRHLRNRALMLAPLDKLTAIRDDYLADMKRLLEHAPASWHVLSLHSIVQEARVRLNESSPHRPLSPGDERFFRQLVAVADSARASLGSGGYDSVWSKLAGSDNQKDILAEPHYFFSADGGLAFLLARPVKEAGSFTAAGSSVAAARDVVASVRERFPTLRMGLTGMPVLETDEMTAAESDTRLASWLAIAGVSLLFLIVYRGIAYPLLTVLTLLVGTAWAFGFLTLTVGHLNILSATFAVMLIGMGDYGVLWVMRYEHARKSGQDVRSALLHTTTHVAIGNLTAASTLALAFFAALFADFKAVAELGWIAGCGVLLCAFACFSVLPALLTLFDRRGHYLFWRAGGESPRLGRSQSGALAPGSPASVDSWLPRLLRRPGLVLALGLLLALGLGACALRVRYDHNLLHLQARNLESVQWEMTLIEHTAGASWHALSYTRSREEALALRKRYEQLPEVSQVIEIASLVPPDQDRKVPMVADIHQRLAAVPPRGKPIAHARPDVPTLREDLADVLAVLKARGPDGGLKRKLLQSIRRLDETLARQSVERSSAVLQTFDQRLAEDLAENLHRLRDSATPAPVVLAELPEALRERYVGASGAWLLRVFAREGLWDYEPLARFTQKIHEVDPEATGKPFGTVEGLRAMKNGLIRAGLYAFAVIVFVLWLDFRSLGNMLLALLPLVLGVLCTLGVLGLFGLPLNPANMIAFPLILGVGVDNGVHVLHDYLIRRREGKVGVSRAIGRGVLVKALTTMMGFAALMVSTERGLAGLGLILTVGVGCSMLCALVLLPAALKVLSTVASRGSSRVAAADREEPVVLRRAA